jgi:hypothetical protein
MTSPVLSFVLLLQLSAADAAPAQATLGADCPVPAERRFASFAALHNYTDAEIFAMTCLDPLVEPGGVPAILKRLRAERRPLSPMQAALLLRRLPGDGADARAVRAQLLQSLNTARPVLGYWTDPRLELRAGKGPRARVVAVEKGKGVGTGGVAKGSGDAYVDPLEIKLLEQTSEQARVELRLPSKTVTGWVDKRKLVLPAVLGFRAPDDRAPSLTFVPGVEEELVVLGVDDGSFTLGFPAGTPAAPLTLTCDRVTGKVTAIGSAGAAAGPTRAAREYLGRDCVSFATNHAAGHALAQPGVEAERRFFVHGWPADCRY